jgi:hypothetical protein
VVELHHCITCNIHIYVSKGVKHWLGCCPSTCVVYCICFVCIECYGYMYAYVVEVLY